METISVSPGSGSLLLLWGCQDVRDSLNCSLLNSWFAATMSELVCLSSLFTVRIVKSNKGDLV